MKARKDIFRKKTDCIKIVVYFESRKKTCIKPWHCKKGFGNPDENDRGCYGDRCPSTEICKEVAREGLRWEYV